MKEERIPTETVDLNVGLNVTTFSNNAVNVAREFIQKVLKGAKLQFLLVIDRLNDDGNRAFAPTGVLRVGFQPPTQTAKYVIPETVTILSLDIQSGTRSPFETVYEYHHRNFYMFNERNSAMFPYRAKTAIILTNEIAGTPTIKTSTSVGTMRVRL